MALETPEHSGRVRGIGGFVTPKLFFNLPRQKRTRISKAELSDELDRQRKEIADLKALISATSLGSPISDKSSCQRVQEEIKATPSAAKELNVDNECVALDPPPPPPQKMV